MRTRITLAALALAVLAAPLAAQDPDAREDWEDEYPVEPSRWFGGVNFTYARPQGEFGRQVEQGWGGDLHAIYQLDEAGILGLRMDAGYLNYGHERQRVPLSPTTGGRIQLDLTTTNNIAFIGVGPQIGLPDGRFKAYAHGFAGISFLWTESSVAGTRSGDAFASTTHIDDQAFTWGGGAGVFVPLKTRGTRISLDVGVDYRDSGRASYLREGSITDEEDNTISFTPIESDTDLMTFRIGVSIGGRR
jgi:opacity protein-like surface antigen